ncbi:hypothetical protein AB1Y20_015216 [Prymnesium parvum]|uniref:RING-type domain-containing protein n=1 Tax=Prymnesium parvum TaxID=97485 RepID=A0AB34JX38_PRYPA
MWRPARRAGHPLPAAMLAGLPRVRSAEAALASLSVLPPLLLLLAARGAWLLLLSLLDGGPRTSRWEVVLLQLAAARALAGLPVEECAICSERTAALLLRENGCGHRCCARCWWSWLRVNASTMERSVRSTRRYTLHCWGCTSRLDRRLVLHYAPRSLVCTLQRLAHREELIRRTPANARWVDCQSAECVGVGYEDSHSATVMCFQCELQWPSRRGWPQRTQRWLAEVAATLQAALLRASDGSRPCPHCGMRIKKVGGCPMMRCTICQNSFRWGPWWNSVHGVIEEHAPTRRERRSGGWL